MACTGIAGIVGLLLLACSGDSADPCSGPACVGSNTGDASVDAGDGDTPSFDRCIDTPTDPKCLDESTAIFVAGSGNDQSGSGARNAPFKTIGVAIGKIDKSRRRIYVCEGTYPEDLALDATHGGVSIFGGVSCDWTAAPVKPLIGASANPLKIDRTEGLAVVGVAVVAKDAVTGSSVAGFVRGGDVTFKNVRLEAGNGATGEDGVLQPFMNLPEQLDLNGNEAIDGTTGGPEKSYTCPGGGITKGGKGGDLGNPGATGTTGPANGGLISNCTGNVTGVAGVTPANADGAATIGTLQESGWLPQPGKNGENGGPGQGGGGGFGTMGAGGSGGAGGCGGAGGAGGKGGGASIALASHAAKITLVASTLVAKDGGPGGKGAAGQEGQTLFGFRGVGSGGACNGGSGGSGGNGAAGGGGAGGSSIGLVYKGAKPTLDAETEGAIAIGTKGPGGQLAGTNPGTAGAEERSLESK